MSLNNVIMDRVSWVYLDSVHGNDEFIGKFSGRFQVEKGLLIVCDSYESVSNSLARQHFVADFRIPWEATSSIFSLLRLWPIIFKALRISASCLGASETLDRNVPMIVSSSWSARESRPSSLKAALTSFKLIRFLEASIATFVSRTSL